MTWASIPGWPGYEVSDSGEVRSVGREHRTSNRWGPMVRTIAGKVLAQEDRDGYRYVKLWKGGKGTAIHVARLVLYAFVGPPPVEQPEVCHEDHDPSNNRLPNLKWGSRQENEDAKTTAGRRPANTRRAA